MSGGSRHGVDSLRRFVDSEVRQVWAADRAGQLHYLPEGQAAVMRPRARSGELQCPVPGCPDPRFTTRGGSRRDGFMHLADGVRHTDKESVSHLQAKAMLAAWAREQEPTATVREERTIKDPATRRTRRADVLVAWPNKSRVALEVEYKAYAIHDWAEKQADYEGQGVMCSWLFGHLPRYLKPVTAMPGDEGAREPSDQVRIVALPAAVADHGLAVLHVNPEERLIGTVVVDGLPEDADGWWRPERLPYIGRRLPRGGDIQGRLIVCSIDECRLDPTHGLVTPVMDEIAAEQAARGERARPEQEEALRRARARLEALERERARQAELANQASTEQPPITHYPQPPRAANPLGSAASPREPDYHCIQCAYREIVGLPVSHPSR